MCVQSGQRAMQRRPAALTLPGPAESARVPQLSSHRVLPMPVRSRLPEIFTFDLETLPVVAPPKRRPHGKRPRRVLYPAQTRRNRYMPPEERNPALRWLYILCLVICVQVCLEDGDVAPSSHQSAAPALQGQLQEQTLSLDAPLLKPQAPSLQEPALVMRASALQNQLLQEDPSLQEPASQSNNLTCHLIGGLLFTT
ncbi:radiation-inducible immediate-early gene IEX-1 [Ambystoma mexicanum]|uniref:radiation-inducible immediate-early gene IEX-1 n=1 Tax=Ambystoma mexicanum TaxID=8296 RepID=UPI0037E8CC82